MIKAKNKNGEFDAKIKGDINTLLNEFDVIVTTLHEMISETTNETISKYLIKKAFKNGFLNYETEKEGKDNE